MNKTELIDHLAGETKLTKADVGRVVESLVNTVKNTLKKGDEIAIIGFGTFHVAKRAARNGRNPQTGAVVKIAAAKVPKFRAGANLKDVVNGKASVATKAPAKKAVAKPAAKKAAAKGKK